MEKKFCRFNARVTKAYINTETGLKTIEAVASDDMLDYYEERFAEAAIDDMVHASRQRKALKPEEGLVGLQESHWEVFEIGYAVDGMKITNDKNNSKEYKAVLALKEGWPQADELYNDVKEKRIDKQLSVGGYIPDWENDYEVVEETFLNEANEEVKISVGIIKRFVLEHIAVTPPDGAANPRTRFETAKSKGYKEGSIFKSANDEAYQARFNKTKTEAKEPSTDRGFTEILKEVKNTVEETITNLFKTREEEQMNKVEKAKKQLEELQKFIQDNPDELNPEVVKSLGISFDTEEETTETEDTPEVITEKVVKAKVDALEVSIDEKLEVIKGLIPEKVEIPEIPEDQSEKVKSLEETIEKLETRLKAIEESNGGSNQEHEVAKTNEEDTEEDDNEDDETEVNKNKGENDPYAAWR